ncbi:hypothetical protein ACIP4Y_31345 [Streptomyces sp. NPDC088810]
MPDQSTRRLGQTPPLNAARADQPHQPNSGAGARPATPVPARLRW